MDEQAKQAEIARLIKIIRQGKYKEKMSAVDALRDRGWLKDGSLSAADLSGAELYAVDLRSANLSGATLNEAILEKVDFHGATLNEVDFRNVNMSMAYLEKSDLRGANLGKANLVGVKLMESDLCRANFFEANLTGADLTGANLSEAKLSGTNLSGANLSKTNLVGANLFGADLSGAKLTGANLSGADMGRAYFHDTNLNEVNLTNTFLGYGSLGNVELSTVKGLGTIQHQGPTTIGVDTLYKSRGQIPEVFLRGCGVPEEFIELTRGMFNKVIDFYSCFISYSHVDKSFARRVHDTLQGRGIRCWLDEKQTNPGDDIYAEIDRGIRYWDKVLLCCSQSALSEKWWVDHEIDKAFQKERDLMKERKEKVLALIPLDLDGFLFEDAYSSPKAQQIRTRIAANFNGWQNDNALFEREIERVIKALRTDGGKEDPPPPKI